MPPDLKPTGHLGRWYPGLRERSRAGDGGGTGWEGGVDVREEGRWHRAAVDDDGAPAGLAEFCRREHPRLVGALAYYTADRDLAEELAQDALVQACRHWDRVALFASPGAWVHRVAINLANSRFRRRAAKRRAEQSLDRPGHEQDPDTAAAVALRAAIAGLPQAMKTAIVLRYYADLPVREVAEHLHVPENTVKTITRRAIERLRAAGLEDVETPDD
jgi:RNA polymerase sigma-70 factor, ECF subfamily